MAAVILCWNPDRWDGWDYRQAVRESAEPGGFSHNWRVGRHRDIRPGDHAWLLLRDGRNATGRGLLGHGLVVSAPSPDVHPGEPAQPATYIDVVWDALLPRGDQIPPGVLSARVPGVGWESVGASGTALPAAAGDDLRALWAEYAPLNTVDPTVPAPGILPDSALMRTPANRYECSPQAARLCIEHHGDSCAACGFSFGAAYGEIGTGFIQVHHIVPVAQLGPDYELDPLTDLVPLCPNCHAMAHRRAPDPFTPAQLRLVMSRPDHEGGEMVSSGLLELQSEAVRLLGTSSTEQR